MSSSVSASPSLPDLEKALNIRQERVGFNIKQGKVSVSLKTTSATSTSGAPVHYNEKLYDSFYYDKWFSDTGEINQGETPTLKTKDKKGIMNTHMNEPKFKIRNE